jgi:Tol biopolymer transport system component/DNA-binding winged helix-turn-helix (wHTH) protein
MASKSFIFRFANIEVREREFSLAKAGEVSPVEPKAFRVLLILLRNPHKLIPKEEFLNAVWGETAVSENSLARSIALLRRLLGDETRDPRYIETVATVGYRWVCKVEVAQEVSEGSDAEDQEVSDAPVPLPPAPGRLRGWAFGGGGLLALCLAGAFWYLHRPLPPPRITGSTRVTTDGHEKFVLSTDGNRLYFVELQPNSISQVGISGGEIAKIPVTLPGMFWGGDISPDGSSLLTISHEPGGPSVWMVRVLGGTTRRIANGVSATFSPDGNSIAYTTGHGELRVVQTDGTGDHKLASVGPDAGILRWSPDGRVFRFFDDGVLWEISANGSNLHEVLPAWQYRGQECCGSWTPDGKFYLFDVTQSAWRGGQIWALDERRGLLHHPLMEPVQLTTPGPIGWGDPIPGKGTNKVFSSGRILRGELSRFDPETKQLQPFLGGISAQDVSFSKDGRSVAYVSFPDGILWKADRDGSNTVQLSAPPIYAVNPRWSPDGSAIVFTDFRQHSPDPDRIYLVPSQGGTLQQLVPDSPGDQGDSGWSADGRKIVFGRNGVDGKGGLCFLDLPTRQVSPIPGSAGFGSPRWSPNGKYIAAFSAEGLEVLDVATQRWSTLPLSGNRDYNAWSSDSKYIYFLRRGNDEGVYRIRASGGTAERVADLKDWHITGFLTYWMALDPTDAPLLMRDVGSDDIYALTLEEK